ncbi:skeletal muscle/kidney enriched inositol 5-phosphatase [Coprinopsis sp. MPI-PUGE-AT-0042]|nr:skeletal muscle/kidney enriched inositol 5-phosphatase [Coprinopsis sp. MPI-PUGE-AT-0042]
MASQATAAASSEGMLVQIASYNTNLQGDLVDWLAPTLQKRAPDFELLPLHLGLAGLSKSVLDNRNALILSQIEAHAPNQEPYSLVAKIANAGIALLVYARDDGVAKRITDVQTQWTGSGPCYMGNKGAVGVRFNVAGKSNEFVNCHLTPHSHKLQQRLDDYKYIVSSLLFKPISPSSEPSTLYDTSHLFFFGDMNFRLDIPTSHPLSPSTNFAALSESLKDDRVREDLKEFDQLLVERRKGDAFVGLREGEFWKFKCSYKCVIGEVDQYRYVCSLPSNVRGHPDGCPGSTKRTPSWTDRVLYSTYTDSPDEPEKSSIRNLLYTTPLLRLPPTFKPTPDPNVTLKKYSGRVLDRLVGTIWWCLTLLGAGSGVVGLFNFAVGLGAFTWWTGRVGGSDV